VAAEHAVAGDADGRVVAGVAVGLAVSDTDGHLGRQPGDLEDDRVVRLEGGGQRLGVGMAQVGEVTAEGGVR
jgi:hypothetical protein